MDLKLYLLLLICSSSLTTAGQVGDAVESEIMKSSETLHTDEDIRLSDTKPASQPTVVVTDTVVNGRGDTQDNCEGSDNVNIRPVSDHGDTHVIVGAGGEDSKVMVTVMSHDTNGDTHPMLDCGDGQLAVKPCGDDVTSAGSDVIVDSAQLLGPAVEQVPSVKAMAVVNETATDGIRFTSNEDTISPDHVDANLKDRQDITLPDHLETNSPNHKDTNLKDHEDATLPDPAVCKLKDCEDTNSLDHVDTNLKDRKDTTLPDHNDPDLTDCKDTGVSDNADTNLKDPEDTNLPDQESTNMAGCGNTSLFGEKVTILQDADSQHGVAVVVSEKVADVNENCDVAIVRENMTDRDEAVEVPGDVIQKVDVAVESLDINDKAENGGIDINRNSDLGEERSGVPTGTVVTSNNTKHAVSSSVHSATGEEESHETTETVPRSVPDISVTMPTCVNSDSNDAEAGVANTENTSRVTDDPSGSTGRMSPLVTVSDADGRVVETTPTCIDIDQLNAMTANLRLSSTSSTSTPLNCRSAPRVGIDGDASLATSLATQLELDVFADTPEKRSPIKGRHLRSPRTISMKDGDYKARSCHRDGSFIGQSVFLC